MLAAVFYCNRQTIEIKDAIVINKAIVINSERIRIECPFVSRKELFQ